MPGAVYTLAPRDVYLMLLSIEDRDELVAKLTAHIYGAAGHRVHWADLLGIGGTPRDPRFISREEHDALPDRIY